MAQVPSPPPPSGSEVSKIESDVSQTITLAGSIVTLLREPVSLLYQNVKKREGLERSLGHWQGEARDDYKQCRIPILRLTDFETYLVKTDGHLLAKTATNSPLNSDANEPGRQNTSRKSWGLPFPIPWQQKASPQPDKSPSARACWALLLRALGICPGMNIVDWKPSNDGLISTQNGGIEMEVDGAVLCHIMNLYSPSPNPRRYFGRAPAQVPSCASEKVCNFPFGRLAWNETEGQIHAHFEPGQEKELDAEKVPFDQLEYPLRRLDPNTWIATYLSALENGISDSDFYLADIDAPIEKRIEKLLYCFNNLDFDFSSKRLISAAWFEDAARVKRRVLADGGNDHSFFIDICEAFDKRCTDGAFITRADREKWKQTLRERFMLDEGFTMWFEGSRKPSFKHPLWDELASDILATYEHQPPGTWKRELYEMRGYVLRVLKIDNRVFLKNFWFLEFTKGCPLWNERVLLGAPSLY